MRESPTQVEPEVRSLNTIALWKRVGTGEERVRVSRARPDIWVSSRKAAGEEAEEKQAARSEEDGET